MCAPCVMLVDEIMYLIHSKYLHTCVNKVGHYLQSAGFSDTKPTSVQLPLLGIQKACNNYSHNSYSIIFILYKCCTKSLDQIIIPDVS